ncbi:hypothetical protein [Candidatus Nephthysia bennettiae]|uniref:hypothetical protein n=1 Tax=Candidatus Nephthysia bennettiae TaxID=3127016 RepID=UPI0030C6CD8E
MTGVGAAATGVGGGGTRVGAGGTGVGGGFGVEQAIPAVLYETEKSLANLIWPLEPTGTVIVLLWPASGPETMVAVTATVVALAQRMLICPTSPFQASAVVVMEASAPPRITATASTHGMRRTTVSVGFKSPPSPSPMQARGGLHSAIPAFLTRAAEITSGMPISP